MKALRPFLAISCLLVTHAARAITSYAGFELRQLDRAPLLVEVQGERRNENVPIWVMFPTSSVTANDNSVRDLIAASTDAPAVPLLPKSLGDGYQLRLLKETAQQPVDLANGQLVNMELPVFAYVPTVGVNFPSDSAHTLVEVLASTKQSGAARSAASQPVLVRTLTPDKPAKAPEPEPSLASTPPTTKPTAASAPALAAAPCLADLMAKVDTSAVDDGITNQMTITQPGDIITNPTDLLRKETPRQINFDEEPLGVALKALARESRVSFDMDDDLPKRQVTVSYVMSPFAALEKVAIHHGAEVLEEDGVFHIKRLQPDALQMEIFQLKNITLGESSAASGSQTFGAGFTTSDSASPGRSAMGGASGSSYQNGGSQMSSGGAMGYGNSNSSSGAGSSTSGSTGLATLGQFGSATSMPLSYLSKGSNILINLKNLLALQESNTLETAEKDENGKPMLSTAPSARTNSADASFRGTIDYNSSNNTITVVATRQQLRWARRYLDAVDVPECQIAIDALFVESDVNPATSFGVDWGNTANGLKISSSEGTYGGDAPHSLPAMLSGTTLTTAAVNASVFAWVNSKQARIYQRPTVVTKPDREVLFATTKNIPVIDNAQTTAAVGTVTSGNTSSSLQTAYTAATQSIGTIVRLRAVPVRKDLVSVTVSLEISSPDSAGGSGESLTGRVQTTSTNFTGVFDVAVGKTLAIGGLERVADETNIGKVPGLGSIPFFGFAFKHKAQSLSKTHITLFITPRMIESALQSEHSAASSEASDRRQLQLSGELQAKSNGAEDKLYKANK